MAMTAEQIRLAAQTAGQTAPSPDKATEGSMTQLMQQSLNSSLEEKQAQRFESKNKFTTDGFVSNVFESMESVPVAGKVFETIYKPVAEAGVAFGLALPLSSVGGMNALRNHVSSLVTDEKEDAAASMEAITQYGYTPQTPAGEKLLAYASLPFALWEKLARTAGDYTMEITGNPELSTSVYTGINYINFMKAFTGASKGLWNWTAGRAIRAVTVDTPKVRQQTFQSLRDHSNNKSSLDQMREAKKLTQEVDGLTLSLAEKTADPFVISQQKALKAVTAKSQPELVNLTTQIQEGNKLALRSYYLNKYGDAKSRNLQPILNDIVAEQTSGLENIQNLKLDISQQILDLTARIKSDGSKSDFELGEMIRKEQLSLQKAAKKEGKKNYDLLGDYDISFLPLKKTIDSLGIPAENMPMRMTTETTPAIYRDIKAGLDAMEAVKPPPVQLPKDFKPGTDMIPMKVSTPKDLVGTFQTLVNYKKEAGIEYSANVAAEAFDPYARSRNRNLATIIEGLDDNLDLIKEANPELIQQYEHAKSYWNTEVFKRFQKGAAARVVNKSKDLEFSLNSEKVMNEYFSLPTKTTGGVKAVKQFLQTFGNDDVAMKALFNKAYHDLYVAALDQKTGMLDPVKTTLWVSKHRDILKQVPNMEKAFANKEAITQGLYAALRNKNMIKKQALLESSIDLLGQGATKVIDGALKDRSKMKELITLTRNNPEVRSKAIGDFLLNSTIGSAEDFTALNPVILKQNLNKYDETLSLGMNGDHLKSLHIIADVSQRMSLDQGKYNLKTAMTPQEKLEQKSGTTVTSLVSRVNNSAVYAQTSPRYVAFSLVTKFINTMQERQLQRIEYAIFHDQEAAKIYQAMLEEVVSPSKPNSKADLKKLADIKGFLLKTGEYIKGNTLFAATTQFAKQTTEEYAP